MINRVYTLLSALLLASFAVNCQKTIEYPVTTTQEKGLSADSLTAKYIFLFIGDGMGSAQVGLAEKALESQDFLSKHTLRDLVFTDFPVCGSMSTHSLDRSITGSAAAATAMATGHKTNTGIISMNPERTKEYESVAKIAKKRGWKVGILTTVSIDHATPAAFYANSSSRSSYSHIASQMAPSNFDYFAGAARADPQKEMIDSGYRIMTDREELLNSEPGKKIWAYNSRLDGSGKQAMIYNLDTLPDDYISLSDFTEAGIKLLDNEKGFFMMVEAGKLDWACHANDAAAAAGEILDLNNAVKRAYEFAEEHPDETLIIVTGDHETGGLSLGYAGTRYNTNFPLLAAQKRSFEWFDNHINSVLRQDDKTLSFLNVMDTVKKYFGLGDTEYNFKLRLTADDSSKLRAAYDRKVYGTFDGTYDELSLNYGGYDPISVTATSILGHKAGIDWSTYAHTGVDLPVYTAGAAQDLFKGSNDNTDIAKNIIRAAGFE